LIINSKKQKIYGIICIFALLFSFISADNVRIMIYNLENYREDGQSESDRNDDFRLIVNEIQPDIIIAQEIWGAHNGADRFLNNVLNYENQIYDLAFIDQKADWDSSDDIWHDIGVFYKAQDFRTLSKKEVEIADGYVRDALEVQLEYQPVKDTITVYGVHFKAGNSSSDESDRASESLKLRSHCNHLPLNTHFFIAGDYNIYTSSETAWQNLTESQNDNSGRVFDPIDRVGDWHENENFSDVHTQSTRYNGGGLDDRFDFILISGAIQTKNKINYISDSYTSFGNDGQHFNSSVNYGGNRAVRDEVANALYNASDHLPVYADFEITKPNLVNTDSRAQKFTLHQNYPNPFNSSTTLKYFIQAKGEIELNIYDLTGKIVTTIQRHHNSSGHFSINWNPKDKYGDALSSGIYFYQVRFKDDFSRMRKMILIK